MTDDSTDVDTAQTLEGARAVLFDIAATDLMREEHQVIAPFCDERVLRGIIDLAWRHQFSDDRHPFKREIRELQEYVALKAREGRDAGQ